MKLELDLVGLTTVLWLATQYCDGVATIRGASIVSHAGRCLGASSLVFHLRRV